MTDLTVRFPYDQADKETQNLLKPFFKQSSEIIEVSFPNPRVNVLKIKTADYTLFVGKILAKDKPAYIELGKALADVLKDIEKGEIGQVPKMTITLNKSKIVDITFDWQTLQPFKKKADGWYTQWQDDEYVDFFAP